MFDFVGEFFKRIIKIITDVVNKIIDSVKKFLPYILVAIVVLAIFFQPWLLSVLPTFMGPLIATIGSLSFYEGLALALGTSLLIAPDETVAIIGDATHAVGEIASEIVEVGSNVLGDVLSASTSLLLSNPLFIGGLALTAFFLLKDDNSTVQIKKEAV